MKIGRKNKNNMLMTTVPKYKPWSTVKEELNQIVNDPSSPRRNDNSLCLTHGFHHQVTYYFKEAIRCVAYKCSALREEFLVSSGIGSRNAFHHRMHHKYEDIELRQMKDGKKENENYANRFPFPGRSLEHLVWIPRHKFFIAIGKDKNFRVYADTLQRCHIISAPTVCPMPVLSIVYLEETDEVVTGGIGIIQPWKIGLYEKNAKESDPKKQTVVKLSTGKPKARIGDGNLQQMLQATAPLPCNFKSDEWVVHMKVYRRKQSLLIAISSDSIVIVDYIKRQQLWRVQLESSEYDMFPKNTKVQKMHPNDARLYGKSYVVQGHLSMTRCDFYPKFGYFITGGGEGTIRILHMVNFGLVTTLRGHRDAITGLIAHNQQNCLLSASLDGSIRIWCLETFKVTQRLDTDQNIVGMHLCNDPNMFYCYSKQQISLFKLTNVCSLYSVMHSSVTKLKRAYGDLTLRAPGKVIAAQVDGSVAVLCPLTGQILTMIYPMNNFQVFSEIVCDPLHDYCYLMLQEGEVLQYDCSHNPSTPDFRFVPSIPYDEDVMCLGSAWIRFRCDYGITAVFAGLRNGQIALIHPNVLYMESKQAHTGSVKYLGSITLPNDGKTDNGDCWWSREKLVSVGSSAVRIWFLRPKRIDDGKYSEWEIDLEPQIKLELPDLLNDSIFLTNLSDRLCVATHDNQILVLEFQLGLKKSSLRLQAMERGNWFTGRNKIGPEDQQKYQIPKGGTKSGPLLPEEGRPGCSTALIHYISRPACTAVLKNRRASFAISKCVPLAEPSKLLRLRSTSTEATLPRRETNLLSTSPHSSLTINPLYKLHTHHNDDDHKSTITALESSQKLNCFASSSEDGYVKIWDEENRLIREMCFIPHRVTSMCFVNGRDLLVAFDDRICLVECSTFMTRTLIKERNIMNLNFIDEINEPAIPHNARIRTLGNIDDIQTVPLEAFERTQGVAEVQICGIAYACRMRDFKSPIYITSPESQKSQENETKEKIIAKSISSRRSSPPERRRPLASTISRIRRYGELTRDIYTMRELRDRWKKRFMPKVSEEKVLRKRVSSFYPEKHEMSPLSRKGTRSSLETNAKLAVIGELNQKLTSAMNKSKTHGWKKKRKMKVQSEAFGSVPNSMARFSYKRKEKLEEKLELRLRAERKRKKAEEVHPEPDEESRVLTFDWVPSTTGLLPSESVSTIRSVSSENITPAPLKVKQASKMKQKEKDKIKKEKEETPKKAEEVKVEISEEEPDDKKIETIQKKKKERSRKPSVTSSADLGSSIDETYTGTSTTEEVTETAETSDESTEVVVSTQTSSTSETTSTETSSEELKKKPRFTKSEMAAARSAMKDKLKKQIQDVLQKQLQKEEVKVIKKEPKIKRVPSTLKNIIEAAWFRKKLSDINPDSVALGVIEMGNTLRVLTQGKACEALGNIVQEFADDSLSSETLDKINEYLARFIKSSNDPNNSYAKHPNRVDLVHNALDTIRSTNMELKNGIKQELFRLLADTNNGIKDKAKLILESKLGIDTIEKLCKELKIVSSEKLPQEEEDSIRLNLTKSKEEYKELTVTSLSKDKMEKEEKAPSSQKSSKVTFQELLKKESGGLSSSRASIVDDISSASVVGKSLEKSSSILHPEEETKTKLVSKRYEHEVRKKKFGRKKEEKEEVSFPTTRYKIEPIPKKASVENIDVILITNDFEIEKENLSIPGQLVKRPHRFVGPLYKSTKKVEYVSDITRQLSPLKIYRKSRNPAPKASTSISKYESQSAIQKVVETKSIPRLSQTTLARLPLHHISRKIALGGKMGETLKQLQLTTPDEELLQKRYKFSSMLPQLAQKITCAKRDSYTQKTLEESNKIKLPPISDKTAIQSDQEPSQVGGLKQSLAAAFAQHVAKSEKMKKRYDSAIDMDSSESTTDRSVTQKSWANAYPVSTHSDLNSWQSVATIEESEDFTMQSDGSKAQLSKLIMPSDMGDSGFVESFKTEESHVKSTPDGWRDALKQLRALRLNESKSYGQLFNRERSQRRCKSIRRVFNEFILTPQERVASHFLVENSASDREKTACPHLHGENIFACCQGRFSFRYGILTAKWINSRMQQSLNKRCGEYPYEIWRQEAIRKLHVASHKSNNSASRWNNYEKFVANDLQFSKCFGQDTYSSKTNVEARRVLMNVLLNQKDLKRRKKCSKRLSNNPFSKSSKKIPGPPSDVQPVKN